MSILSLKMVSCTPNLVLTFEGSKFFKIVEFVMCRFELCSTGRGLPLDEDGGDLVDVALAALDARAHRHVDLLADLVSVLLELQEELHVGNTLETRPADRPVGVVLLQIEDEFTLIPPHKIHTTFCSANLVGNWTGDSRRKRPLVFQRQSACPTCARESDGLAFFESVSLHGYSN